MNAAIASSLVQPAWDGTDFMVAKVAIKWDHPRKSANTYSLSLSPEGAGHRQVFQGPLVTERWAVISPEATVIARHHIADERPTITLQVGDILTVEGHGNWRVDEPSRFNYDRPVLTPVN